MFRRKQYNIHSEDFEADPGESIWLYSNKINKQKIPGPVDILIDGQMVGTVRLGERLYITFDDKGLIDSWYTTTY